MNLIPAHRAPDILAGLLTVRRAVAVELLRHAGLPPIHFGEPYLRHEDIVALADRILRGVADALSATGGVR
jgi:hypothetical protein